MERFLALEHLEKVLFVLVIEESGLFSEGVTIQDGKTSAFWLHRTGKLLRLLAGLNGASATSDLPSLR